MNSNIDYLAIATDISEWVERNYGYFVNKNSDKVEIVKDFAEQLARLDPHAMSFIQQSKNNLVDDLICNFAPGTRPHPPTPLMFLSELRKCVNKEFNPKLLSTVIKDETRLIHDTLFTLPTMDGKLAYINKLVFSKNPLLRTRSVATMEIESVLRKKGYTDERIGAVIPIRT